MRGQHRSPLGLGVCKILFMPSKTAVCFPQSSGRPIIKICRPLRPDSWGSSVPLTDPQAGKSDVGFRTFTIVWERLWYYCSPVCGSPTWWLWGLILSWLCPSYHLTAASSLSLDVGCLFQVGSSILLSMVVQQPVPVLVLSQEEMSTHPSAPPSRTRLECWVFCIFY